MSVVGVDPGLKGAICYNAGGTISVIDMPTYEITIGTGRKTKTRNRVDAVALYNHMELLSMCGAELVVIEEVGGRPGESAAGAFQFGWAAALVYMSCVALKMPIKSVKPAEWKKVMGVPGKKSTRGEEMTAEDKKAASKAAEGMVIQRADEIFPAYREIWRGARGGYKLDRAEAALLSQYGLQHATSKGYTDDDFKHADA